MTRATRTPRSLAVAIGLALLAFTSHAQADEPSRTPERPRAGTEHADPDRRKVTLARAIELASHYSPLLGPAAADQDGAEDLAHVSQSALLRPPELSVTAGPRFTAGATRLDVTTTLLQPVSLGGAGRARENVGSARRNAARARVAEARAAAWLAAASAWVASRSAGELLNVRRDGLRQALGLEALAEARAASGATTAGERALARSLRGAAVAAVLEAEGRDFAASLDLAFQCGEDDEQLVAVGELDGDAAVLSEARALAASAQHPRLTYLDAEAAAAEHAARQLRAEGRPWLMLGPSLSHEGTGDWIVLGHVSVPLPLVNQNDLEASDRARLARVAKAEGVRARLQLRSEVRLAWHEVWHARRSRDALLRDAVEPARSALTEATLRYQEGKAGFAEVLVARRALTEIEERSLEARGLARLAELRLQAITGQLHGEAP